MKVGRREKEVGSLAESKRKLEEERAEGVVWSAKVPGQVLGLWGGKALD